METIGEATLEILYETSENESLSLMTSPKILGEDFDIPDLIHKCLKRLKQYSSRGLYRNLGRGKLVAQFRVYQGDSLMEEITLIEEVVNPEMDFVDQMMIMKG